MTKKFIALLSAVSLWVTGTLAGNETAKTLKLQYDRPADFFEEALVLGNGTMGATVYGGCREDRISLNDITLWTGEPDREVTTPDAWKAIAGIRALLEAEDYRGACRAQGRVQGHYSENYQPLGTLTLHTAGSGDTGTGYRRTLNISDATATVEYEDGGAICRDYFVSAPDSVFVLRIRKGGKSADAVSRGAGRLDMKLVYDCQLPHTVTASGNEITVDGYAAYHSLPSYYKRDAEHFLYDENRGIHFRTLIRVVKADGEVRATTDGTLDLSGCTEVLVLVANVTSFNGFDKDPVREGRDYKTAVARRMELAAAKDYETLRVAHVTDYHRFFNRVTLDLGKTDPAVAALPTDRQLRLYTDSAQVNPELETLYFQYGRYLLISCSRTPGVPANLQGLWNEKVLPPWSCNYTTNINLEENYWAAETTHLSEMHTPLLTFIGHLAQTGSVTAQAYYGVGEGWCLAHNTDIWAMTCPVGLGSGGPEWANWTMGGAWVTTHIWEHYLFTQDKEYLRSAYPLLKGAADFCLGWLVEKEGWLITSPGVSPENKFIAPDGYVSSTSYGNTSDLAMIRECLIDTRAAARTLHVDAAYCKRIDAALKRLRPYRIGKNGNLQEWYHDWPDQDPRHRHQSHLFGLYPGCHLSPEATPELARACARTLEIKGDKTTGWSTGWRVNLYARLQDGEKAYRTYRTLLRYVSPDGYKGPDARRGGGTYPNLLDAHSPFQIDGNFGGCAGVAEMLLQSSEDRIVLLPALPERWSSGKVKGLCARGGYVVDMAWDAGRVTSLSITSKAGGRTTVLCNGRALKVKFKAGQTRKLI